MDTDYPIPIMQLEQAINYWRARSPATGEESRLCPEAAALATPYALMILHGRRHIAGAELEPKARAAYDGWLAQGVSPATP
jgi:hypothetical protein